MNIADYVIVFFCGRCYALGVFSGHQDVSILYFESLVETVRSRESTAQLTIIRRRGAVAR